ncbi:MAG: hypothetical protein HYY93_15885 [Planctomycetes bacterium]|nr:hypothetical protein [Planctomycetota bacterium]
MKRAAGLDKKSQAAERRTRLLELVRDFASSWIGAYAALLALLPDANCRMLERLSPQDSQLPIGPPSTIPAPRGERDSGRGGFARYRQLHSYLLRFESVDVAFINDSLGIHTAVGEQSTMKRRSTLAAYCAMCALDACGEVGASTAELRYWAEVLSTRHSESAFGTQGMLALSGLLESEGKQRALSEWMNSRPGGAASKPTEEEQHTFWDRAWPGVYLDVAKRLRQYPHSEGALLGLLNRIVVAGDRASPEVATARQWAVQVMSQSSDWSAWISEYGLRPSAVSPEDVFTWRELWRAQNPLHPIWAAPRLAESKEAKKFIDMLLAQTDWAAWLAARHPDWGAANPPTLELLLAARKAWVADQGPPR